MKSSFLAVLVLLAATPAFAAPAASTGGTFYWCSWDNVSSGYTNDHLRIYSQQVNANWDCVGTVRLIDTISMTSQKAVYEGMQFAKGYLRDVEIDSHGQLLVMGQTNITPPSRGSTSLATYQQPWDLLSVDTTQPSVYNNYTMVNDGRIYTANTDWDSVMVNRAMRAPAGWAGKASSYVTLNGNYQSPGNFRIFQIYPSGVSDNAAASGRVVFNAGAGAAGDAVAFRDAEFGPDGALYFLQGNVSISMGRNIKITRLTWNSGLSRFDCTTFLSMTGSAGKVLDSECPGLAIGGTAAHPIVYLSAVDNGTKGAIFALQDKSGDGVVSWDPSVDCVTQIWKQADSALGFGIISTVDGNATGQYMDDVEFDNDGTHSYLQFCTYGDGLGLLQLADNGVAVVSGKQIFKDVGGGSGSLNGPFGSGVGIEFDPNPVPEPMSLLLLGTGALGAISWMRRRRVK